MARRGKDAGLAPRAEVGTMATAEDRARFERMERLAVLLDTSIGVPGTRFRFGADAIIGLVPGLGDVAGAALATHIIVQAIRLGVPPATLMRMAANVGIDMILGTVPLVGDLFDAAWKPSARNIALVRGHVENPVRARAVSRRYIVAALALVALSLIGAVVLLVAVARAIPRIF